VDAFREKHQITVKGREIPNPIMEFKEAGLNSKIMALIDKNGFKEPTPIQAQVRGQKVEWFYFSGFEIRF